MSGSGNSGDSAGLNQGSEASGDAPDSPCEEMTQQNEALRGQLAGDQENASIRGAFGPNGASTVAHASLNGGSAIGAASRLLPGRYAGLAQGLWENTTPEQRREMRQIVRGPLGLSKGLSRDICKMYQRAQFGAVRYVISSANLVRYVLPDTKTFQVWFRTVVQRLPSLSAPSARVAGAFDIKVRRQPPMGVSEAVFGTPVPREAFDPSFDLSASSPTALIDAMLVRIAGRSNPFLWTTAELNAAGFPGTPYRYPP
jgi:hypothetical protein